MDRDVKIQYLLLLEEQDRRRRRNAIRRYYPDEGPLRRELYPKHLAFFAAGTGFRQRLMLAANRVGKTEGVGGYELALHLTGQYPAWWTGRRFNRPITAWAAGDTGKTVREILQSKLVGPMGEWGTGLIPGDCISRVARGSGVADSIDTVYVRHICGRDSRLTFKSYDQRREAFQGTEQDVILLDEEPPLDVYTECLMRTMTNNGMIMLTFTPLTGMSEVVLAFLPGGKLAETPDLNAGRFVIMATWDDVPHLSDEVKRELWASIPPFQRDARSKGIPQLGAGAIYPIPESDITVQPFVIPKDWLWAYGLDVGWNRTAAVWGVENPKSGERFLVSEHYRGQAEPVVHAEGIKARGSWIPGVIDPAARGRSQKDGSKLITEYRGQGLDLASANNAVETGLLRMWQDLSVGRLKVFAPLSNWFAEYRLYRRDEDGKVVKENDHLMDASRYLNMSGWQRAAANPQFILPEQARDRGFESWMNT